MTEVAPTEPLERGLQAPSSIYTGRFAPSPTGPLHFGSLVSALAGFLDARAHRGRWLVRIEDLDPPRVVAGADRLILDTLEQLGLCWDGSILYQHTRLDAYEAALDELVRHRLVFPCTCSRSQLPSSYPGTCRSRSFATTPAPYAHRVQIPAEHQSRFFDRLWGEQCASATGMGGDFVIRRKDGFFAYQLAVVVDDQHQGVTHIVRGADLLEETHRQLLLQRLLGYRTPSYCHTPIVIDRNGFKLSKQTGAPPIDPGRPAYWLFEALRALNQSPPPELLDLPAETILTWGIEHFDLHAIGVSKRPAPIQNGPIGPQEGTDRQTTPG